jgi:hypothetical protein
MATQLGTLSAKSLMRSLTLTVRISRMPELRFRLWLGMKLIRLAAWVMWCNIRLEKDD